MGNKEHAFKQIRHYTTWTNSLTKSSALCFHALLAATYIQHCVSGNFNLQKLRSLSSHRVSGRPCRRLGAKGKLSRQFDSGFHVTTRVTQPLLTLAHMTIHFSSPKLILEAPFWSSGFLEALLGISTGASRKLHFAAFRFQSPGAETELLGSLGNSWRVGSAVQSKNPAKQKKPRSVSQHGRGMVAVNIGGA